MSTISNNDQTTTAGAAVADPPHEYAALLNCEELMERCLGNLGLVERVLGRFVNEFPGKLNQLGELARNGEREEFYMLAHQLKGATANIAAPRMQQHFADMEQWGCEYQLADVEQTLSALALEWVQFQSAAQSLLEGATW